MEVLRSLIDIVGGLPVAFPEEKTLICDDLKNLLGKYLMRRSDVPIDKIYRLFLLINDLLFSQCTCRFLFSACHGGGSEATWNIAIWNRYDFKDKVKIIEKLTGLT